MIIDQPEAGRQALLGLVPACQLRAAGGEEHLVHILLQLAADDRGPERGQPVN